MSLDRSDSTVDVSVADQRENKGLASSHASCAFDLDDHHDYHNGSPYRTVVIE
jgi:hypothetical protein